MGNHFLTHALVVHFRSHNVPAPNWRIMVDIEADHSSDGELCCPRALAVIDDFGTLVIVGRWL